MTESEADADGGLGTAPTMPDGRADNEATELFHAILHIKATTRAEARAKLEVAAAVTGWEIGDGFADDDSLVAWSALKDLRRLDGEDAPEPTIAAGLGLALDAPAPAAPAETMGIYDRPGTERLAPDRIVANTRPGDDPIVELVAAWRVAYCRWSASFDYEDGLGLGADPETTRHTKDDQARMEALERAIGNVHALTFLGVLAKLEFVTEHGRYNSVNMPGEKSLDLGAIAAGALDEAIRDLRRVIGGAAVLAVVR